MAGIHLFDHVVYDSGLRAGCRLDGVSPVKCDLECGTGKRDGPDILAFVTSVRGCFIDDRLAELHHDDLPDASARLNDVSIADDDLGDVGHFDLQALALPVLTLALVMQLLDRTLGTGFFIPAGLTVNGVEPIGNAGQPLLWQPLWFLAHSAVIPG